MNRTKKFLKKEDAQVTTTQQQSNPIFKLCFCSLALTCIETKTSENVVQIEELVIHGKDVGDQVDYIQIKRIPSNIARLFWNELLEIGQDMILPSSSPRDDKECNEMNHDNSLESIDHDNNDNQEEMTNGQTTKISKYWRYFITETERNDFFQIVEDQTSSTKSSVEKIQSKLSSVTINEEAAVSGGNEGINKDDENDDESYRANDDETTVSNTDLVESTPINCTTLSSFFVSSSLATFFEHTLSTIFTLPSIPLTLHELLLFPDVYFQCIKNTLLQHHQKIVELVIEENYMQEYIKQQENIKYIDNLHYFLDGVTIANLKHFFNREHAREYLKLNIHYSEHATNENCDTSPSKPLLEPIIPSPDIGTTTSRFKTITNTIIAKNTKKRNDNEQCFFNSCIDLIKLSKEEGGFAIHMENENEFFRSTFELWNHIMADVCLKLYHPDNSTNDKQDNLDKTNQFVRVMTGITTVLNTNNKNHFDIDAVSYAIKLLPSHLMRVNTRIKEAIALLQSSDFLSCRCYLLGVGESFRQYRQDCLELRTRLLSKKNDDYDLKESILSIYNLLKQSLKENSGNIITITDIDKGKLIHGLAFSLERMMEYKDESLDYYLLSLKLKKQALVQVQQQQTITNDYAFEHSITYIYHSLILTLTSISNIQLSKGCYKDGIIYLEEKLSIQRLLIEQIKTFDTQYYEHQRAISTTLQNLAMMYGLKNNNYDKSLQYYEEAVMIEQNVALLKTNTKANNNKEELGLIDIWNNLGRIYDIVSNYEKCYSCYYEVLKIALVKFGEFHFIVAKAKYNLGRVLYKQQRYNESINYLSESYSWRQQNLPKHHEDIARTLHTIGAVNCSNGNMTKAISSFEESIQITKHNHGPNHELVARRLFDLAMAYKKDKRYNEALETKKEIVRILKEQYQNNIDDGKLLAVAESIRNLGLLYKEFGYYEKGIEYFLQVLDMINAHEFKVRRQRQKQQGEDHGNNPTKTSNNNTSTAAEYNTTDILHDLGCSYYMIQSYDSAIQYLKRAYILRVREHGRYHIDVAKSQFILGVTHYQRITNTTECNNNLDNCYDNDDDLKDDEKALMYLSLALKNLQYLLKQVQEPNSSSPTITTKKNTKKEIIRLKDSIANTLHYLALLHKDMYFDYAKSLTLLTAAHKLRQYIYGKNHVILGKNKYVIGTLLSCMGRYSDAMKFYSDALIIYDSNKKQKRVEDVKNKMRDFVEESCIGGGIGSNKKIIHNIKQWIIYLRDELKGGSCK